MTEKIYFRRYANVNLLRKRLGMVFQKPNPFPMSIYDNVAFGPRTHGIRSKAKLDEIVEKSLRDAAIWDEVKDRLKKSALGMSGGQQQRLCIARALAVQPEVILWMRGQRRLTRLPHERSKTCYGTEKNIRWLWLLIICSRQFVFLINLLFSFWVN